MTKAQDELLACPSGHVSRREEYDDEFEVHWIGCDEINCEWRTCGKTRAEAIAAWNRRTPPAAGEPDEGVVERVARALAQEHAESTATSLLHWSLFVGSARAALRAMPNTETWK